MIVVASLLLCFFNCELFDGGVWCVFWRLEIGKLSPIFWL